MEIVTNLHSTVVLLKVASGKMAMDFEEANLHSTVVLLKVIMKLK